MSTALQTGALVCTVLGMVSALGVLTASRDPRLSLKVLLEFLLAAGLLRLSDDPSPSSLLAAVAIVGVRRLVQLGLRRH